MANDLLRDLQEARTNQKWRHDYMTWTDYGNDCREEGREEGIKEGRNNTLYILAQNGKLSLEDAAATCGMSENEFIERMHEAGYRTLEKV